MLKTGLSIAHFRRYVPLIEKETSDYFERWGDSGQKGISIIETLHCHCVSTCGVQKTCKHDSV